MLKFIVLMAVVFGSALTAAADDGVSFIYLVRHAEKQKGSDPVLTDEGTQRSNNYAAMLAKSNTKHVFTTDYKRTRLTAEPVAKSLSCEVETYDPRDMKGFAKKLLAMNESVFVVGHSNTTFDLAKLLGGDEGKPIGESEYDRVYQLVVQNGKVIHTNLLVSTKR